MYNYHLTLLLTKLSFSMKFLSFSKFIELDRDDNDVSTGDPIKKVKSNNFVLSGSTCNNKHASGIIIRKGSWKKSQVDSSFKITTNSIENPQIKNKTILPSSKSSW